MRNKELALALLLTGCGAAKSEVCTAVFVAEQKDGNSEILVAKSKDDAEARLAAVRERWLPLVRKCSQ